MKKLIFFFSGLFLFLTLAATLYAQSDPPPGVLDPPDQTPIDGGLSILAAAGGIYAIKKLRERV